MIEILTIYEYNFSKKKSRKSSERTRTGKIKMTYMYNFDGIYQYTAH